MNVDRDAFKLSTETCRNMLIPSSDSRNTGSEGPPVSESRALKSHTRLCGLELSEMVLNYAGIVSIREGKLRVMRRVTRVELGFDRRMGSNPLSVVSDNEI